MIKKGVLIIFIIGLIAAAIAYFIVIRPIFQANVSNRSPFYFIEVRKDFNYADVLQLLKDSQYVDDIASFETAAKWMRYNDESIKNGRYKVVAGWTNKQLVAKLRSGSQDASKVVINNVRTISDLAGKLSNYFEADSLTLLQTFRNPENYAKYNLNGDNFMSLFIPNTYEIYWNTTPDKFLERMKKEYDKYWTKERVDKAKQWNLTPTEAYTLASIVEKESNIQSERPIIAGVYLNRLKIGDKLRADPTVVFATGLYDLKRVLYSHLEYDSPYNTYLYEGLPPGPIYMPSLQSIEAVINAQKHNFMYFCAKPGYDGSHSFSETYAEHLVNARNFANWLNQNNIK